MKALTIRRVNPGSNRVHTLSEMADDARDLRANGTDISDEIVCLLFLQVLPQEYDVFRHIIEREKEPLTIDGLMGELRARFDLSRKVKSRSSDIALVASGSRREKGERVGAKHNVMGKKPSSSRGDNLLAVPLHREKRAVRFFAAFARKQGINGSSAPNGSAASAEKPDTTLINVPR